MAVEPQIDFPVVFEDFDGTPGSGTPFNAANLNPNFVEVANKFNSHTHNLADLADAPSGVLADGQAWVRQAGAWVYADVETPAGAQTKADAAQAAAELASDPAGSAAAAQAAAEAASDPVGSAASAQAAAEAASIPLAQKGAPNGVATLDASGLVPAASLGGAVSYVAAPTGVAATDTTAIQAAIDAINLAGGGKVALRAGIYTVTSLTLKRYVQLVGATDQGNQDGSGTVIQGTTGNDIITLPTVSYGDVRIADLTLKGGRDHIVSATLATKVRIERVVFESPSQAAIHITAGSVEELYMKDVHALGGQYFYRHENVTAGGNNYLDKTVFENVLCTGQTENAYKITVVLSNSVTWINPILDTCQKQALYADGGLRQWVFINTNTEQNGQAGKNQRTTGSISSNSSSLTVASATGYSQGDSIVVAGAGANGVDLFSTISTISGTTFTLADNAGTTVSSAKVTNASYDDFYFGNSIAAPGRIIFVGGSIGSEGTAGKLRYAVNAAAAGEVTFLGVQTGSDDVPVYDSARVTSVFGGKIGVRQPNNTVNDPMRSASFATSSATAEFVRTLISSPPGRNILLSLRDSADNGTGTYGQVEVRRLDSNRTLVFRVQAKAPVFASDGFIQKYLSGAGKTTVSDSDFAGTPGDGTIALHYDTTANKAYVSGRFAGSWKVLLGPL